MIINRVEIIVGETYHFGLHEVKILEAVEGPYHLPYIRVEVTNDPDGDKDDVEWELWYGANEYYTFNGWHGLDGEGAEDERLAELIKK